MSKECFICNKKLRFLRKKFNFVSSDIEIVKFKAKYQVCYKCNYVKKYFDISYRNNLKKIYKLYKAHSKFKNKDQKKIQGSNTLNRCSIIYKNILKEKKFNDVLDFGTGNGSMAYPFLKKSSKIIVTDLKNNLDHILKKNKKINFIELNKFQNYQYRFDLITLNHVFEHITNPVDLLNFLKTKLKINGKILIQIPDFVNNPFDLIIFDHTFHYTLKSIFLIAKKCNLKINLINRNNIYGEISIILGKQGKSINIKKSTFHSKLFQSLNFLNNEVSRIKKIKNFSLLGTSISSLWVYSNYKSRVKNFYDEDKNKINKLFFNKKIRSLESYDSEILVLPFFGKKKKLIKKRLMLKFSNLKLS